MNAFAIDQSRLWRREGDREVRYDRGAFDFAAIGLKSGGNIDGNHERAAFPLVYSIDYFPQPAVDRTAYAGAEKRVEDDRAHRKLGENLGIEGAIILQLADLFPAIEICRSVAFCISRISDEIDFGFRAHLSEVTRDHETIAAIISLAAEGDDSPRRQI